MRWFNRLLCRLFGHQRNLEDLGGVLFETCRRCNWVGRSAEYDPEFQAPWRNLDPKEKADG